MLINIRISELLIDTSYSIPLAIIISISFYYSVHSTIPHIAAPFTSYIVYFNNIWNYILSLKNTSYFKYLFELIDIKSNNSLISFVTSGIWDSNLSETSHITSIGNILYTSYSLWLIITSLILLLAMVGSIIITLNAKFKHNNGTVPQN